MWSWRREAGCWGRTGSDVGAYYGAAERRHVDVAGIAAAAWDLAEQVSRGQFRRICSSAPACLIEVRLRRCNRSVTSALASVPRHRSATNWRCARLTVQPPPPQTVSPTNMKGLKNVVDIAVILGGDGAARFNSGAADYHFCSPLAPEANPGPGFAAAASWNSEDEQSWRRWRRPAGRRIEVAEPPPTWA